MGRAPIPENISGRKLTRVLNSVGSVLVHHRYVTKRPRTGEGCDLGNSGVWEGDYGWGVRVRRPFGARGRSSVRYGTRLGDLKNKQSTHTGFFANRVIFTEFTIFGNTKEVIQDYDTVFDNSIPFRKNDPLRITYFRIQGVPGLHFVPWHRGSGPPRSPGRPQTSIT